MAHYDSRPLSPGAADTAAGVAVVIETARLIASGPPPLHDVVFLLTDAEEAGYLGIQAFTRDPRWKGAVRVAINLEARGNFGAVRMFETSVGNGWLIGQYSRAVSRPSASSLFYEIYKVLPNDTDFSVAKEAGFHGYNFAFVGGYAYYHTAADTPHHLAVGSVQELGDQVTRLSMRLAAADTEGVDAADVVYFDLLRRWIARYPVALALPLACLAVIAVLWHIVGQLRRNEVKARGLAGGALAYLVCVVVLPVLSLFGWLAIRATHPSYTVVSTRPPFNAVYHMVALTGATVALFTCVYAWLSRRALKTSLVGGALLVVAVLTIVAAVVIYARQSSSSRREFLADSTGG